MSNQHSFNRVLKMAHVHMFINSLLTIREKIKEESEFEKEEVEIKLQRKSIRTWIICNVFNPIIKEYMTVFNYGTYKIQDIILLRQEKNFKNLVYSLPCILLDLRSAHLRSVYPFN